MVKQYTTYLYRLLYIKVIVQVSAPSILQTPRRDRAYPVLCLECSDDFPMISMSEVKTAEASAVKSAKHSSKPV